MKASVVIPTLNRADTLDLCLRALCGQTLEKSDFEVIVVDNGSTDHTEAVVRAYEGLLSIGYLSAPEPGLHVGRHAGIKAARSEILMFVDDDIQADASWIEAVVAAFRAPDVGLVGGNNHPNFEIPPPPWLVRWWEQPVYKGRALGYLSILDFGSGTFDIDPRYVWGCNFSIRRGVLLDSGGFHPDAVPKNHLRYRGDGETHVSNVIRHTGQRAVFDSRASVRHFVPKERMTRSYFEHRAYMQGISDSFTDIRRACKPGMPMRKWIRRHLSAVRWTLRQHLGNALTLGPSSEEVSRELLGIQQACFAAHHAGYKFHQKEVRRDASLLEWVLRNDYLDAR